MGKNKPIIGLVVGILVCLAIFFVNIPGLSHAGHLCLAFSMMTVLFWGFGIAQPGYVSGLYLFLLSDDIYDVVDCWSLLNCRSGEGFWVRRADSI